VSERQYWGKWQLSRSLVLLVLWVFLLSGLAVSCRAVSESDARSAINQASQRVVVCYGAVVNATKAGANASALLSVLDDAGSMLSKAEVAFASGDFDLANDSARQSMQGLDGFEAQALGLQNAAARADYSNFMFKVVGSIVEAVVVLVGSFVVWSWLKTRQRKAGKVVA
jgi:hypothetical protein